MIADRGWIRSFSEVARNVDAETSRLVSLVDHVNLRNCMTDLDQHEAIQVFVGVDVGKGAQPLYRTMKPSCEH